MERLPDGSKTWKRSPGGLVTALEPLLRRRRGAWIGWPGIPDADDEPFEQDDMYLYPVRLSADDVANYYEGFSNAALWPLYHDIIVKPIYHRQWWDAYVEVNRRFAEATAKVAAQGATVWVQDYQLQLVPKMLRMLRPDLTIGFFLHIPFPPVELFMQMPWRTEITEGLLGADLIGFNCRAGRGTSSTWPAGWQASPPRVAPSVCGPSSAWCRWASARSGSARSRFRSPRPNSMSIRAAARSANGPRKSEPNSAIRKISC